MSDTQYRVGIIGLGPVAVRRHQSEDQPRVVAETMKRPTAPSFSPLGEPVINSHAWAISHIPELDIVAVCDIDPARVERFRDNWGHQWPDAEPYRGYRRMLTDHDLDIAVVATSEHRHADPVVAAAETGVRAIYCEKPLATSLDDADRMIAACKSNGVVLTIDYTRRWNPLFQKVRETISSGAIGEVGTISTALGGTQAWMFRSGSHLTDSMCLFAEATPVKVSAHLEDGYDDWDQYRGKGGGNFTERDPGATGYVVFDNGVRAFYSCLKNTPDSYRDVVITGATGYIVLKFEGEFAELHSADPNDAYRTVQSTIVPSQYRSHGIEAAYREMIDNIENGSESSSPAREARKSIQILMGFLKSHQEGGRLVDVPE